MYTAHYIKPDSVSSYLSGICNQLELFSPDVRSYRHHWLVTKTLAGCHKIFPSAASRKCPLPRTELINISNQCSSSSAFDDCLFLALLLTGFHGLMRLGELMWPDNKDLRDYRNVIMRNSVQVNPMSFQFTLPGHKADRFFEGSLVPNTPYSVELGDNDWAPFTRYLHLRDHQFPLRAELWLREDGTIPTHTWFLQSHTRRCHHVWGPSVFRLKKDFLFTPSRWLERLNVHSAVSSLAYFINKTFI